VSEQKRTDINSLGEFGLIEHLTKDIKISKPSTVLGIGDDAAIVNYGDKHTVISTDLLIEGIHFDLSYTPLKHLGYKAVIVNLSDIYAMNAQPSQITFSMALSNRFSVEALEEIYKGIELACKYYNVDLIGGDTTSSLSGLVISVTAIGEVEASKQVQRNTAREGDLICCSGDLGAAYFGLQLLEREKQIFLENPGVQPELEQNQYLVERILKPEARKDIIDRLAEADVRPTSMIDISDGLSSEIMHICTRSKVGCLIEEKEIPISDESFETGMNMGIDSTTAALNGGEDYELLFTIKESDKDKLTKHLSDISIIGEIKNEDFGYKLHSKGDNIHKLEAQGWKHFNEK